MTNDSEVAKQKPQRIIKNTTVNPKDIEFTDPKEFEVPSVVAERNGKTYYADGSFSIRSGGYSQYTTFHLPNGVVRVCSCDHLVREEIPDGRIREYRKGEIKYDRDADGNYRMYDDEGVLREEGNSKGWQKRYYGDLGTKKGGRDSVRAEIFSSGYYKVFGSDYDLQEEGNLKTGEYKIYRKFNGARLLEEEGTRRIEHWGNWVREFEDRGMDDPVSKNIYEDGRLYGRLLYVVVGDKNMPEFSETRPVETVGQEKLSKGEEIRVCYYLKSDGSGLYLSEAGPYKYDEKGRMVADKNFSYKYHGDTKVVAEVEQKNGKRYEKYDTNGNMVESRKYGITTKYDDKGRIIQNGKDDDNCVRVKYYGDTEDKQLEQQVSKGKVVDIKHWDVNGKNDTKNYLKVKSRYAVLRKMVAEKIDERDAKNPDTKKERVIKNKTLAKLKAVWLAKQSKGE